MGPGALSCLSLSPFFLVWFSCPQVVERDSSYPPLADGPSLPTPSRIGRMASRPEGGGGNLFPTFGWSTRSPFSRRGLAFVFRCVVFSVCFLCFDSLRELMARVVCLFVFFFLCWCQHARPWFLIRELGELWSAFLSTRGLASCCCSVLPVCLLVFVALRRVVSFLSSLLALLG